MSFLGKASNSILSLNLYLQLFKLNLYLNPLAREKYLKAFKKVSIIIVIYNNLQYTKKSLSSLIKYTYFPYELILVDNGSKKETIDWLEQFMNKNEKQDISLIKLSPKEEWSREKKIYSAKNIGLKEAKGDLIIVNDNDILYAPFWIFYAVAILKTFPQAGIVGLIRCSYKSHCILNHKKEKRMKAYVMNTIAGYNLIFPRKVLDKIGYFKDFPQNYAGLFKGYTGCDVEFTLRLKKYNLLNIVPEKDMLIHMEQPRGVYR